MGPFAAVLGAGAACFGWGLIEARLYRLNAYTVPVLPHGADPIEVLQVSDTHLRPSTRRLARFVESLAEKTYDMVFATGDLLGSADAAERCAEMLNSLNARYGKYFVLGSSDYYAPVFKNYLDYFMGRKRFGTAKVPTAQFTKLLADGGWTDLTNTQVEIELPGPSGGLKVQITGLDDPHLGRDNRTLLERLPDKDFALCVVHDPAPYLDAARAGYDLTISGHTHGGQVRFPLVGALVTNSPTPRSLAMGLNTVDDMHLFVTRGLGTGKFAPFRFMCPPEASELTLVPRAPRPPDIHF